jgi:hypothetical protein
MQVAAHRQQSSAPPAQGEEEREGGHALQQGARFPRRPAGPAINSVEDYLHAWERRGEMPWAMAIAAGRVVLFHARHAAWVHDLSTSASCILSFLCCLCFQGWDW